MSEIYYSRKIMLKTKSFLYPGLESGKENWLKAIEQDKRIWINVSTFQEFETPVTFDYAVTSVPANVLIDNSGRVIAKNLPGKDLN